MAVLLSQCDHRKEASPPSSLSAGWKGRFAAGQFRAGILLLSRLSLAKQLVAIFKHLNLHWRASNLNFANYI